MAEAINTTRRGLAGGIAAITGLFVAPVRAAESDDIEDLAARLAEALTRREGGNWRIHIDIPAGLVVVAKKYPVV